jgi:hypothetical protein
VGFVVDKVVQGQVFTEYFGFPCQLLFHRLPHTHHLSSRAGTMGQLVANVPSGHSLYLPLFLILYEHMSTGIFPSGSWVDDLFHGSSYMSFTVIRSSVYPVIE